MLNRFVASTSLSVLLGSLAACGPSNPPVPVVSAAAHPASYMGAAAAQCERVVDKAEAEAARSFAMTPVGDTRADLTPSKKKKRGAFEMTREGDAIHGDKSSRAAPAELAERLTSLSHAFKSAQYADQLCHTWAMSVAVQLEHDAAAAARTGVAPAFDPALERANTPAVLAAVARADALAASTTGMLAALGMVGKGASAKAADDLSRALAAALTKRPAPKKEDAAAFWAFAARKARELKDVAPALVSISQEEESPEHREIPVLDSDPGDASKAKALRENPKAIQDAALGLFRQDQGEAMRAAVVLFPSDSPLRNGLGAANALTRNDFQEALLLARRMVAADSEVGKALAALDGPTKG